MVIANPTYSEQSYPFETQDYGSVGSVKLQVSESCYMRNFNNLNCIKGNIVDISKQESNQMWNNYYAYELKTAKYLLEHAEIKQNQINKLIEANVWKEIDIVLTTSFYPKDDRLFSFEDSYQFDDDTWICVGDCMHPLIQIPFTQQCNEMDGRAYFNSNGDGIICDLPQNNDASVNEK